MNTILMIQPRISGAGAQKTPEEIVRDMAVEMKKNLPG